ncbi:MAG TPA: hypothetical protein P5076_19235 [Myxococcota bacterium]|nr:hypothetical protein [Myxococcota bacterium]
MKRFAWILAAVVLGIAATALAADLANWGGDDCKAIARGDASYCTTDDCKGIVKKDASYCR